MDASTDETLEGEMQYRLGANPAEIRRGGWMISYSLSGDRLVDETTTVDVKTPEQLEEASREHAQRVLAANPQIEAVAISRRPVTRHANGCKALPFNLVMNREGATA